MEKSAWHLDAETAREFLARAMKGNPHAPQSRWTYGQIAVRCGFASRSFLRDFIHGQKRLSDSSVKKIVTCFPLPKADMKVFAHLVDLDNGRGESDDGALRSRKFKALHHARAKARAKYLEFAKSPGDSKSLLRVLGEPKVHLVYAALGDPHFPRAFSDVARMTCLNEDELSSLLAEMARAGLVEKVPTALPDPEARTYPHAFRVRALNLALTGLPQEALVSVIVASQMRLALSRLETPEAVKKDENDFFAASTISIGCAGARDLKLKLREWIAELAEEVEEPEGDGLVSLVIGAVNVRGSSQIG